MTARHNRDLPVETPNTALLIVDVQVGFVNDATRHILSKVVALQSQYAHVYATRFVNAEGSPYRKLLDWHRFYANSGDVPLAFEPVDGVQVIDKNVYTCVTPAFVEELRGKGIEEVAICGIDTDACVTQCAIDLFQNGFRPVLLSEACASHAGAEYHDAALRILARLIGKNQIV
ncbi:MAG: cysteine hydrolase [Chloroflexi bacterium]|nr:cysteine hydrolase [Chloroflexota bacterium]